MINRCYFFFFKQKTAYEMRISDWSSDVCSSDLFSVPAIPQQLDAAAAAEAPAPSSAAKPAADSDDSKIAEIVVTAQRREEKLQEVPIAVTAMDAKQIETREIGRAPVWTPVTNSQLVCRLLIEKKKKQNKH